MAPDMPSYASPGIFLGDGFQPRVSQGLILVGAQAYARQVALDLHERGIGSFQPAVKGAGLNKVDLAAVAGFSPANAVELCDHARNHGHWLYLENAEQLTDSSGGRNLLDAICGEMAEARLPCVIASTSTNTYKQLENAACRLIGLVPVAHLDANGRLESVNQIVFLMAEAKDRGDTGWTVAVRYQLTSPMVDDPDSTPDPQADSALRMVDQIAVVGERGLPEGVMISFKADAFQVGQRSAVFNAAEVVARRVVGRKLGGDERVDARRGVCYT
jgi:hypothetical protein